MTYATSVRVSGSLARHAQGFCAYLKAQGYTDLSARNLVHVFAHLSRWLTQQHLEPADLTAHQWERFLRARRRAGYTGWRSKYGLRRLIEFLTECQVLPTPLPEAPTPLVQLLDRYSSYLVQERSLTPFVVQQRRKLAQRFLTTYFDAKHLALDSLNTGHVTRFVRHTQRTVGAKCLVSDLRCFLRFLHVDGHTPTPLVAAVPAVAGWRLSAVPRALESNEVERLLQVPNRRTSIGRRDYAILLLLARLGLRAGEVAAIEFNDVDWHQGEIMIRGKGRHEERLPLPEDVGKALVAYLKHGRPRTGTRVVFLRSRAPYTPLTSGRVSSLVRDTCAKAGIPCIGSHGLRHTAARQMLRHGASLAQIAQVLRHRSLSTTAIYAKVDHAALEGVAQPWPGRDQ